MSSRSAKNRSEVTSQVRRALNAGERESANLVEFLTIDFRLLARNAAPKLSAASLERLDPQLGVTKRMAIAGEELLAAYGVKGIAPFLVHTSDTVRGWAAYALCASPAKSFARRLTALKPLADDSHFGVREWAWMALRPHVAADLESAISELSNWTRHRSANLRRFATEITRPRGVWCTHLNELKEDPTPGLAILEPLRTDGAKYVQDSVANWLNDAAKSQPSWVQETCRRWLVESPHQATQRICKRAQRSL